MRSSRSTLPATAGFRHGAAAVLGDYEAAHDAVQDGFARALARRETYRGGSLEAWIWRIVHRCALDTAGARIHLPLEDRLQPAAIGSE
jgi:DNA-directed RNA polymerase specialized sigma24 family protein